MREEKGNDSFVDPCRHPQAPWGDRLREVYRYALPREIHDL